MKIELGVVIHVGKVAEGLCTVIIDTPFCQEIELPVTERQAKGLRVGDRFNAVWVKPK